MEVENNYGCTDDITHPVEVKGVYTIYVPNAFTPDNDGNNDFFPPQIKVDPDNYLLRIFDRWGQLMYETRQLDEPWNGKFKDEQAQMDVYVWKIKARSLYGDDIKMIGRVSLLR
ncbi:MAG: gliding motility-associated C-terminal domain-containing protein [Planctomycetes bacterium]|nr:gliding motility-associated C-terminal domain-containing protein [Planctomycetota bacterium]